MDSNKTLIGLLRHGETGQTGFRGSLDDELTAHGLEQMFMTLGDQKRWGAIVCSPLVRCNKFARRYAEHHGIPYSLDDRLRELHFGSWEGTHPAQLKTTQAIALTQFWSDPYQYTPPGAEPLSEFEGRVLTAWKLMTQKPIDRRILMVTHGGVIRVILRHIRGLPRSELLKIKVPHASLFQIIVGKNDLKELE